MQKFKKYAEIIIVILFAVLFVVYSKDTTAGVIKSINICIDVIIPSMFAYMVISGYIISSSLYKTLFRPFYFILHRFIKLDKQFLSIFLLSLIGGYPIGIKLLTEIIAENKSYSAIADKVAAFCYCISPTFATTMIGLGIYNSAEIGLVVYFSNVISNFIVAIIYTNIYNLKCNTTDNNNNGNLIQAINSSACSLAKICSVIVIFNAVITAVSSLLNSANITIPIFISAFFEISNILNFNSIDIEFLPIISMISSTGGICVLFQCYSIAQDKFSIKNFLIGRIPSSILSGLITLLIIKLHKFTLPVSTINNPAIALNFSSNRVVILLLSIMCIILFQKNEKNFKKG